MACEWVRVTSDAEVTRCGAVTVAISPAGVQGITSTPPPRSDAGRSAIGSTVTCATAVMAIKIGATSRTRRIKEV